MLLPRSPFRNSRPVWAACWDHFPASDLMLKRRGRCVCLCVGWCGCGWIAAAVSPAACSPCPPGIFNAPAGLEAQTSPQPSNETPHRPTSDFPFRPPSPGPSPPLIHIPQFPNSLSNPIPPPNPFQPFIGGQVHPTAKCLEYHLVAKCF